MQNAFRWAWLTVASVAFGGPALAANNDDVDPLKDATTLDLELLINDPVVTATGGETSRALAPANVVTWDRDEIRRHGWTTLADVLSNTPGLYVNDDLVMPSLGVRGVGPGLSGGTRLVRIMVNGIQVNFRSNLTAFLGQEFIPFEAVERIEIAKGPLSSLYGANAFLATVNVITRDPRDGIHGELGVNERFIHGHGGFGFGGQVQYGSDAVGILFAYNQSNLNRSGLHVQKSFPAQNDGAQIFQNLFDNPSQNDRSKPRSFFSSIDLRGDNLGTLKLQAGRQVLQSNAEFQPPSRLSHASEINLTNDWASLQYLLPLGEKLSFGLSFDLGHGGPGDDDNEVATAEPEFVYKRHMGYTALTGGAFAEAHLPARMSIKAGVDYTHDRESILYFTRTETATGNFESFLPAGIPSHQTISNFGAYVQLGGNPFDFAKDLYFTGNARIDSPNLFNTQFTWRLGAAYEWTPRVTSKLFVGQAFQTPSAQQIFAEPGFGFLYNTVGNRAFANSSVPPIEPQKSVIAELNTTFAITDRIVLDGSLFYQRVIDKTEFLPLTNDPTTNYTALNLSDQEFFGGELGLRASAARFSGYLTGSTQALTNRDLNGSRTFKFDAPREFPKYTVYAALTTRLPEAFAAIDIVGRLVGPRGSTTGNTLLNGSVYELPSYAVFDLNLTSLNWFIFSQQAETKLTVSMRNVFNNHFQYPSDGGFDIPNVGRNWYLQLSQTF